MPRRKSLGLSVVLAVVLGSAVRAQEPTPRRAPNILLLYADDWRHDTLGAAGHPVVETPHLDALAAAGVRFTRSYVTTSICGVSRASLFTGQWMSRHGCRAFNAWKTPWEETWPALLRAAGYHVGHVGKWHNGRMPSEQFDFARAYHGRHWYPDGEGGRIHVTERNEADALEFLRQRPADAPFCLTVAFFATHAEDGHPDQFLPQPESAALYADVDVPVPVNATAESWARLPDFFDDDNEGRNRWRWRFDTPEKYQRMMKDYFRLATEVDATCGRILAELERQGVGGETLVIFTTDNGYYHAEHGLADKWYPHEESIRVPLIVRDPRMDVARRGTTDAAMVLNVDLAPTLLAAAGVDAPDTMQGRDLAGLYLASKEEDEVRSSWRSDFFYEHPTLRSAEFIPASQALVRADWKYLWWPEHEVEQLFDLVADPREERDLAGVESAAEQLAAMRVRFEELREAAK